MTTGISQNSTLIWAVIVSGVLISAGIIGWFVIGSDIFDDNDEMKIGPLTIVDENDSKHNFYLEDLKKLPTSSGQGSFWHTQVRIEGPLHYAGVSLVDLLSPYIPQNEDYNVIIRAQDNYTQTLTKSQVEGQVLLYDENEKPIGFGNVTPLLAYEKDSAPLGEEEGPFRLAFVSPDNPVTQGHLWVRWVIELQIQSSVEAWQLDLFGVINQTLSRTGIESAVSCTKHQITYETEINVENRTYQGMPLWLLVAACDGDDPGPGQSHFYFNESLATEGYTIRLISSNGFADFASSEIARNDDIIIAVWCDGQPLAGSDFPLKLLGPDVPTEKVLGGITQMWLLGI